LNNFNRLRVAALYILPSLIRYLLISSQR